MIVQELHRNFTRLGELQRNDLVTESCKSAVRCKSCGTPHLVVPADLPQKFPCTGCPRNVVAKLSNLTEICTYPLRWRVIKNRVKKCFENAGLEISSRDDEFVVEYDGKLLPITFLENSETTELLDAMSSSRIVIFIRDDILTSWTDPFARAGTISLMELLDSPTEDLQRFVRGLVTDYQSSERLRLIAKLSSYHIEKTPEDFETEVARLFNSMREYESELRSMFDYLRRNQHNPKGKKFVHLGGNNPIDVAEIQLIEYFGEALGRENPFAGIELKSFADTLPYEKFSDKIRTNRGRDLCFVVNNTCAGNVWADVQEYRRNRGCYEVVVIDRDLLVMLLHFTNPEEFFNC